MHGMHELGLAQDILEIVKANTASERLAAVRTVRVEVGRMAGVVVDSLDFCFGSLISQSPLSAARLECRSVPLRVECADCGVASESDQDWFGCPRCGSGRTRVLTGMELRVCEIELEDGAGVVP